MRIINKLATIFLLLIVSTFLYAGGQYYIKDYQITRSQYIFKKLYINTGESLYCGTPIPFPSTETLTAEHVYAADWIASHFECSNRITCKHPDYKRAEADLHNLWPELGRINSSRSNLIFNEIDDSLNAHRFKELCDDFERTSASGGNTAYVEPRDSVKGNIARSLFYMHVEYGLPLKSMKPMLKRWNTLDPPNKHEYWRNERIHQLQQIRNQFIDDHHLVDSL